MTELDDFSKYLQHEKRFSPHTIKAYMGDLGSFFSYCEEQYETTEPGSITSPIVRSWVVHLMEHNISPRSVNRKITSLKTLYKFLQRNDYVKQNPMLKVQAPKIPKRLPSFVEEDKMRELLDEIPFEENFAGMRDKLIIEMLYATGMRLSELINLKPHDIDLARGTIKVLGKRNKERIIPTNKVITASISSYLQILKGTNFEEKSEFLLVTNMGRKLYPKFVYRLIKTYLGKVTTQSKRSPHVLRHTFATHLLNKGASINAIKELLGHANLSATQIYTHNTIEKLKQTHKDAHPREGHNKPKK